MVPVSIFALTFFIATLFGGGGTLFATTVYAQYPRHQREREYEAEYLQKRIYITNGLSQRILVKCRGYEPQVLQSGGLMEIVLEGQRRVADCSAHMLNRRGYQTGETEQRRFHLGGHRSADTSWSPFYNSYRSYR